MFRWTILDGNVYVDAALGSDVNTGTMASPVQTLNRAQLLCTVANQKVVVRGGLKYPGSFGARSFGLQWIGDGRPIIDGNLTSPVFRIGDILSNFWAINGNGKYLVPNTPVWTGSIINCIIIDFSILSSGWIAEKSVFSLFNIPDGGYVGSCLASSCVFVNCRQNRQLTVNGHSCYFKNNVRVVEASIYSQNNTSIPVPKFADESRFNYHLLPDSPLIGQGQPDDLNGTRLDIGIGGVFFRLGISSPETFEANGAVWSKTGPLNDLYIDGDRWVKRVGVSSGSIRTTIIDLLSEYFIDDIVQGIYQDFSGNVPTGGVPSLSIRWGLTSAELLAKPDTLMQFFRRPTVDASGDGNGAAGWDSASAVPIKARFLQFTFTISDTDY